MLHTVAATLQAGAGSPSPQLTRLPCASAGGCYCVLLPAGATVCFCRRVLLCASAGECYCVLLPAFFPIVSGGLVRARSFSSAVSQGFFGLLLSSGRASPGCNAAICLAISFMPKASSRFIGAS